MMTHTFPDDMDEQVDAVVRRLVEVLDDTDLDVAVNALGRMLLLIAATSEANTDLFLSEFTAHLRGLARDMPTFPTTVQ